MTEGTQDLEASEVLHEVDHRDPTPEPEQRKLNAEEEEIQEDLRRFKELQDLNDKFKKLKLLTQEDDFDYVSKMYSDGTDINDKLFCKIQDMEVEVNQNVTKKLARKMQGRSSEIGK